MALTRAQLIDGALARFPGISNQVASAIRESYATGALMDCTLERTPGLRQRNSGQFSEERTDVEGLGSAI